MIFPAVNLAPCMNVIVESTPDVWVKTADRLPAKEDADKNVLILTLVDARLFDFGLIAEVNHVLTVISEGAKRFPYWMRIPALPNEN